VEQLAKIGINVPWLVSQIINFTILLLILRAFLFQPVLKMLHERSQRIKESMDYAEKVKQDAARAQQDYEKQLEQARREAQAIIAQATQQAERAREEILAKARAEAKEIRLKAQEEIAYERQRMLVELRAQIADLAILAAGRVLGKVLDEKTHRDVVEQFLAETGRLN